MSGSDREALPLRAVVLDACEPDRTRLRALLTRHPAVRIVAEEETFRSACAAIDREHADLLFLDTESGAESWVGECRLVPPKVRLIFTTRDPLIAVRAFELDAVDFLTKPVESGRLGETVRRLLRLDWGRGAPGIARDRNQPVLVPFERGRRGVSLDGIVSIQAFGNYTRVVIRGGGSEIVLRSLAKWEETLPSPPFVRVHRSVLVHSDRVLRLEPGGDGHVLHLDGGDEPVPVSRRCLAEVKRMLYAGERWK